MRTDLIGGCMRGRQHATVGMCILFVLVYFGTTVHLLEDVQMLFPSR